MKGNRLAIVTAVAMVFSAFSSPFLTAVLTTGVFLVGRSADTLARMPERLFGSAVRQLGQWLAQVFPNLMLYVPERRLLMGEVSHTSIGRYLVESGAYALAWSLLLLTFASLLFRRRDFA